MLQKGISVIVKLKFYCFRESTFSFEGEGFFFGVSSNRWYKCGNLKNTAEAISLQESRGCKIIKAYVGMSYDVL